MKLNVDELRINAAMIADCTVSTDMMPMTVMDNTPSAYRLARRSGELVLQGGFRWTRGVEGGFEWRDIPTEEL